METKLGSIAWTDLTVPNAVEVRDFYSAVVGWKFEGLSMGDYEDFVMMPSGSTDGVAGICHARGSNAGLPPVWLIYVTVENLDTSLVAVASGGGEVVSGPRAVGGDKMAVIRDPAGAHLALYETGALDPTEPTA